MRLPAPAKVKVIGRAPELSLDTPRSSCAGDESDDTEEVTDTSASFAAKTDDVAARRPRTVAAAARCW